MRHHSLARIVAVILTSFSVAEVAAQTNPSTGSAAQPKPAAQAKSTGQVVVQAKPAEQAVAQVPQQLAAAFNAGSASKIAALFLPEAELTDDAGNVHKGRKAIEEVLSRFFERFPGATTQIQIESVRRLGASLAIQEGTQTVVTKDGQQKSVNRFTAVLANLNGTWSYASYQQYEDEQGPTPHERLRPLSWLVGEWVDEDSDAVVAISCRWSEDQNFLLVNYESKIKGKTGVKSAQRIGWDPLTERVRSWVFDSDGGYGEGHWTQVDNAWIIKSTAVMPDGDTGSATLVIEPDGKDKFLMKGLDRVLGDGTQPDFQVTVVRKPPQPGK